MCPAQSAAKSDDPGDGRCRSCGGGELCLVLDMGLLPLANALVGADRLEQPEARYPLQLVYCRRCSLLQVLCCPPPAVLFGQEYPYFSSFSQTYVGHARAYADELIAQRKLDGGDLVVEIASNDGYMLQHFARRGIQVLGIEPAAGPAQAAEKMGITTLQQFFDHGLAEQLVGEGKRADVIVANNVLAHVPDPNQLLTAMAQVLKDDAVAVFEVPYVRDLIDHVQFDTIYHEHHSYFSATSLDKLMGQNGLCMQRIRRIAIHGGGLRFTVGRAGERGDCVQQLLAEESSLGIDTLAYLQPFSHRVETIRAKLRDLLADLAGCGARIAGYGAAAKAAVLLNYVGIGPDKCRFIVDRNVSKQGKYMPGVHIPICSPAELSRRRADYVLLFVWNIAEEIMRQQRAYLDDGGKFIVPIPSPCIVPRSHSAAAATDHEL